MRLFYVPEIGDNVVDTRTDESMVVERFTWHLQQVRCVFVEGDELTTRQVPLDSIRFISKCGVGESI